MSNFASMVNRKLYEKGGRSLFFKINESYPTVSDAEYEKIYEDLTEQARQGDLRNLTSEEAYFLLADVYDFENANRYLKAM